MEKTKKLIVISDDKELVFSIIHSISIEFDSLIVFRTMQEAIMYLDFNDSSDCKFIIQTDLSLQTTISVIPNSLKSISYENILNGIDFINDNIDKWDLKDRLSDICFVSEYSCELVDIKMDSTNTQGCRKITRYKEKISNDTLESELANFINNKELTYVRKP